MQKKEPTSLLAVIMHSFYLCIFLLLNSFGGVLADETPSCDSCSIKIDSLEEPFKLSGNWLFTRNDDSGNKNVGIDVSDWVLLKTPGTWKKAYNDNKNFRVGWYRGNLEFAPSLIGEKVVFMVGAYLAGMEIYIDGELAFERGGTNSNKQYYSLQPIPVHFSVKKAKYEISIRTNTLLMVGIYQEPFEIRRYKEVDLNRLFYRFWGNEFRLVASHIILFFGLFFF